MNSDTQQHTDSPVTGDGGVVGEQWEVIEIGGLKYRYRWHGGILLGQAWTEEGWSGTALMQEGVIELTATEFVRLIATERQHHRQQEARLRELVAKCKSEALTVRDTARDLLKLPGKGDYSEDRLLGYADGLHLAAVQLEAILSPDDAKEEGL